MYDTLHWLHAGLAVLSGSGFVVRGVWRLLDSALADLRVVRVLPHVVDALLLALGVTLLLWSQRWPTLQLSDHATGHTLGHALGHAPEHAWLLAKLLALLAYVGLGLVALRFARAPALRGLAFIAALGCFGYMLAVATTRQVLPWAVVVP